MLATHSAKTFSSKIKQQALCARPIGLVPNRLICSQTVKMKKELWACPLNAAQIREWREKSKELPDNFQFENSLPDVTDGRIKQLLLPTNAISTNYEYISVTPVSSLGLLNELFKRLKYQWAPYIEKMIQPTPAARSNHGEQILVQGGAVRMMSQMPFKTPPITKWVGQCIQITARCDGTNVSGGMMATGFPAITAIGGTVHSIERLINLPLEFAFGVVKSDWNLGLKKTSTTMSGKVSPSYVTEESCATLEIVLLIRIKGGCAKDGDYKTLKNLIDNNIRRVSGGSLSNFETKHIESEAAERASYLEDASEQMNSDIFDSVDEDDVPDNLDKAIFNYKLGAKFTLNQTGYILLEEPCEKEKSRGGMHAWVEPAFSLITLNGLDKGSWWKREHTDAGVFWASCTSISATSISQQQDCHGVY